MKTAEEFFAELNNDKTPEQMTKDRQFIGPLWAEDMMIRYAEYYHKQKMEEMIPDDDEVNKTMIDMSFIRNTSDEYEKGFKDGIDWFKSKLTQEEE